MALSPSLQTTHKGWFLYPCRVYLEDVDAGGIVYHANHLKYAERARTEFLRAYGVSHASLMQDLARPEGGFAVVKSLSINYLRPLGLEEDLVVATKITDSQAVSARFIQHICHQDRVAAELTVDLVFVGSNGRPKRWPPAIMALFSEQQLK